MKVAFGSCDKPNIPQKFWPVIQKLEPESFLWVGDAVYAKNNTLDGLRHAFDTLINAEEYKNFSNAINIDGVWDDHDYGVNDGGKDVSERDERQNIFLDFLFGKEKEPGEKEKVLRNQHGLYHSHDYRLSDGTFMKVIFLDTRYHRDTHWIASIASIQLPLTALIAAALRTSYSMLGLGKGHTGDVLGDAQWTWLESELATSMASFHVIVSSIQVLTSNPVVESWGHFPLSKSRLFDLIKRYDPSGLILLSGDVHMAEISFATIEREGGGDIENGSNQLVEVTSSGLTHSCRGGKITRFLCPAMLARFPNHRISFDNVVDDSGRRVALVTPAYTGKNFGMIEEVSSLEKHREGLGQDLKALNVTVWSLEDLADVNPVLSYTVSARKSQGKITRIVAKPFPYSPIEVVVIYVVLIYITLYMSRLITRFYCHLTKYNNEKPKSN